MVAIGALIENIKISATSFHYECDIKIEDDFSKGLIAKCVFRENFTIELDPLFKYIKERQTNRKPYRVDKINKAIINELNDSNNFSDIHLEIETNRDNIHKLANLCSNNEQIVLENKRLHDFLFDHITWTEKEDNIKKGFYIKTLELEGPQIIAFKLLRSWGINKILNKIGISKFVANDNAKLYKQSSAILSFTVNKIDRISFLKTGMTSQRIWLILTKYSIYMQPLTGIIFLYHRINSNENTEKFNNEHIDLINTSYSFMSKILNTGDKNISIMFRIGYADKPTAATKRRKAEFILE